MNTLESQHCPECQSSVAIDDIQNGERICSGCGFVMTEHMTNHGPESIPNSPEEKIALTRATGQITLSQHDMGIATEISISSKDFSGKTINSEIASQMHNLRKWQQRVRVSSSRERRLVTVLTKISEICQSLSLPKNVLETASMIYRNLDGHMNMRGRLVTGISIAAVHMACKQCNVIRSLDEITATICAPKDVRSKSKLAARYYRMMVMEVGPNAVPVIGIDRYISKIANMTHTDVKVERFALEIAEKTRSNRISDGKTPNGTAAAYLYVASILLGQGIFQRDISSVAGVTDVTIRNRCKEIFDNYKIKIALKPSLTKK